MLRKLFVYVCVGVRARPGDIYRADRIDEVEGVLADCRIGGWAEGFPLQSRPGRSDCRAKICSCRRAVAAVI
jgi:hypothetical protein